MTHHGLLALVAWVVVWRKSWFGSALIAHVEGKVSLDQDEWSVERSRLDTEPPIPAVSTEDGRAEFRMVVALRFSMSSLFWVKTPTLSEFPGQPV
jgi:hypothetical protein